MEIVAALALGLVALVAAAPAAADFLLADPGSEIYYTALAVAGEEILVDKDVQLLGNLHSNGDIDLKTGSSVTGDVSVAGELTGGGTVSGTVTAGAPPRQLPLLPSEADLRALADRVLEEDTIFDNQTIDDVVFVAGTVRLEGLVRGTGTVIASGEIRVKNLSGNTPDPIDPASRLSFISLEDIRIDKDRGFRGVLHAARDISIEHGVTFEGTLVAGRDLRIKKDSSLTFVDFDDTPPVITLLSPQDGSTLPQPPTSIEAAFADDLSGVVPATVRFELDGVDRTAEADVTAAGLTFAPSPPLGPGAHSIFLSVEDVSANLAEATFGFTVVPPGPPPTVQINTPVAGTFFGRGTLAIAGDYSAETGFASLELSLDGTLIDISGCILEADLFRCELPDPAPGAHTVAATVTDVGGSAASDAVSFELLADAEPPTIAIVEPSTTEWINLITPVLDIRYGDALSGIDPGTLSVVFDGVEIGEECQRDETSATCALTPLAAGPHTLEASVRDVAGNLASASLAAELIVDRELPTVTISSPALAEVFNDTEVQVTGTAIDPLGIAEVSVNGVPAVLTGDDWEALVPLVTGDNTLVASAVDGAGNEGFASVSVVRIEDAVGPALAFTLPVAGTFVNDPRPTLAVSFDDPQGVETDTLAFAAGGQPLAVQCTFELDSARCRPDDPLPAGTLVLSAAIEDVFGNLSEASRSFIVDPDPIVVTIDEPADRSITSADQVEVRGSVSSGVVELSINGVDAPLSGGAFAVDVPLREGTNVLVALARKASGNTATGLVEVTRDIIAPVVRIESPRDGLIATTPRVAVAGRFNDVVDGAVPATVTVNGTPAITSDGTFLLLDVLLAPGPNVIEAVATDAVGNESRHQVTVDFRPPVGPRVEIAGGNGQVGIVVSDLIEPLAVTVKDSLGVPQPGRLVRFRVSRGSGLVRALPDGPPGRVIQVTTDGAGMARARFTVGHATGIGSHRVTATALGAEGEVEICATALPIGPERILMSMGDNQQGEIGQPLPQPFEALVADRHGNPVIGLPVTFVVEAGGGTLDGFESLVRTTDGDGIARAVLTLGPEAGRAAQVVSASYDGMQGLSAFFTATGLAPGDPAQTRLAGVVVDNTFTPIAGATVSVRGTAASAATGADGSFLLTGVPPGQVDIDVDPSTSTRPEPLPPLHFEAVMVAGAENTLGMPISLPFLETANARIVGGGADVVLEIPGIEGFALKVFADSVTFPDGSTEGPITISQVQLDKVPMAPPNGTFFMPPAWTIQPAGVAFDPPAEITIPNDGMEPGRVIDIFQFDHGINQFIMVGRGTTSEDGATITSDPGYGIQRAGWGGCGQPPPPETCANGCNDKNQCTRDSCVGNKCRHSPLDGTGCDDEKFCTTPDRCKSGKCTGEPKKDQTGPSGSFSLNIDKAIEPAKLFLKTLAGPSAPDLSLVLGAGFGSTLHCCEKTRSNVLNPTYQISGSAGISGTFPTPWSIPAPGGELQGLVVKLAFSGSVAGSVTIDKCDDSATGKALGTLNLTGGPALQLGDPRIVKIAIGGLFGLTGGIVGDASPGKVDWSFDGGHLGFVVSVTFELLNGIVEITGNVTFIEPSSLTGATTTPLTL